MKILITILFCLLCISSVFAGDTPQPIERAKEIHDRQHERYTNILIKLKENYLVSLKDEMEKAVLRKDEETVNWYHEEIDKIQKEINFLRLGQVEEKTSKEVKEIKVEVTASDREGVRIGEMITDKVYRIVTNGTWVYNSEKSRSSDAAGLVPMRYKIVDKNGQLIDNGIVGQSIDVSTKEKNVYLVLYCQDDNYTDNSGSITATISEVKD